MSSAIELGWKAGLDLKTESDLENIFNAWPRTPFEIFVEVRAYFNPHVKIFETLDFFKRDVKPYLGDFNVPIWENPLTKYSINRDLARNVGFRRLVVTVARK